MVADRLMLASPCCDEKGVSMEHSNQANGMVLSKSSHTKIRIVKALDLLCQQKSFGKISIREISEAAGISHSGFYHHFEDKNAIVQWITGLFYSYGVDEIGRTLTWFEGYLATTRGFMQFSQLFGSEAENASYGSGHAYYLRHRRQNLIETLDTYKQVEITDMLAFQATALPYVEIAMTYKYHSGSYDAHIKKFCDLMVSLVPRELYAALETPKEPRMIKGDFFLSVG
jgi:AcrR family transcriptional regulator